MTATHAQERQDATARTRRAAADHTLAQLEERAMHRNAVEAVIWGMPAVNFELMRQAMVNKAKGGPNQIVYWSRLPDWKNQTLTPNPDAVYFMPFIDTSSAGPMVVEIPPADEGVINGSLDGTWQTALEDVGPAGADKGAGARYLILPPASHEHALEGYIALPSDTYQGFGLLRSILRGGGDADVAKAVAYGKRIRLYPLAQAAHPPATTFVDAVDVVFDATIPYDLRFFQSLHRIVQKEPWLERDRAMIDVLRAVGIEKGKPFEPDARARHVLAEAAHEAHAWLSARYELFFASPFVEGRQWTLPASPEVVEGQSMGYPKTDVYPVSDRGALYSFAFVGVKRLGEGQYYLMTIRDKRGHILHGASAYRLHVPAHVPAKQYWSATVYDRSTHAFIRGLARPSRSSQAPGLQANIDGSVDLYFGPRALDGKESNWIPTSPDGDFEVLFRFYGPTPALFDKSWVLPDIEKIG